MHDFNDFFGRDGQNFDSSTHSLWSRKNSVPTFVEFACPQLYCTNERRDGRVRVPITACDKAQTRTGFEFSDRHRRSHYRTAGFVSSTYQIARRISLLTTSMRMMTNERRRTTLYYVD